MISVSVGTARRDSPAGPCVIRTGEGARQCGSKVAELLCGIELQRLVNGQPRHLVDSVEGADETLALAFDTFPARLVVHGVKPVTPVRALVEQLSLRRAG
jgi:hypothetical protein